MTQTPSTGLFTRRQLLGAAALAVAAVGFYRKGAFDRLLSKPAFNFEPLGNPAGYRILESGPSTIGGVPLFGLDTDVPPELIVADQKIDDNICATLFDKPTAPDTVPAAYFYDYQCPICRRLTPVLRAQSGITLTWHDLAGLGPASESAAKAAIAARAQGQFDAFHDRLMRAAFHPDEGYILALADSIGLDKSQLLKDMVSPETTNRMWLSRALADRLAMAGTPGLVIGRTIILGDITASKLQQIVDLEAARPQSC
ncbi:MAG: DsbA family protein [Paracoccaceae bacterium]